MYPACTNPPVEILIVDDNHDAADTLGSLLENWGYNIRIAYSGAQAIGMADDCHPDCILLDINMPEIDGYEVAKKIREQPVMNDIKLVAWTAYSDEPHMKKIREGGFDCYINKLSPFAVMQHVLENCRHETAGRSDLSLRIPTDPPPLPKEY